MSATRLACRELEGSETVWQQVMREWCSAACREWACGTPLCCEEEAVRCRLAVLVVLHVDRARD